MNNKSRYNLFSILFIIYPLITAIYARRCRAVLGEHCQDRLNVYEPCKQCTPCKSGLDLKVKPLSSKVCGDLACYPCKRVSRDSDKAKQHQGFKDKILELQAEPCTDESSKEKFDCKDRYLTMEVNNIVTVIISNLLLIPIHAVVLIINTITHIYFMNGTSIIQSEDALSDKDIDTGFTHRFGRTAPQTNTLEQCIIRLPLMEES